MEDILEFFTKNAMTILTAITAVLLFIYTRETYLLRKESQKQTQSQFTPYLSLRNMKDGATLSNIGKGVALHINFDESTKADNLPILIIPSIGAGEHRVLYCMSESGNGAYSTDTLRLTDQVSITYEDIMGNKYQARFAREYSGMGVFKEVNQSII